MTYSTLKNLNNFVKEEVGWANGSIVNPTILDNICWVAKKMAAQPTGRDKMLVVS